MGSGMQANIFIGIVVTGRLQEVLDGSDSNKERFFRRNDPDYLQMTTSGEKSVIGKRLGEKVNLEDIDNIIRNIISILKIISPDQSFDQSQFSIFTEIAIG